MIAGGRARTHRRAFMTMGGVDFTTLANTQLFLLAQNATVADGAAVGAAGSWPETSNSRDPTQATAGKRPLLRKSGANVSPNGKWMVEFDGSNDLLSGSLPGAGSIPISATGLTCFLYYKQVSLTNTSAFDAQPLLVLATSNGVIELFADTSSDIGVGWPDDFIGANTSTVRDTFGAAQTGYQLLTWEFLPPAGAGASYKAYRGTTQIGVTETNWQATDIRTQYWLGNTSDENIDFNGALGLVMVVSAVYSSAQLAAIQTAIIQFFEG